MFSLSKIRFSRNQTEILYAGLRLIAINWTVLSKTGRSPGAHPDLLNLGFLKKRGVFNKEFLETALETWNELLRRRGLDCRMKLDYIGVSVCLLAIRVCVQQLQHRHLQAWAARLDRTATHLIRKLEAIQKKLKRQIVEGHGEHFFKELSQRWRLFVRWMRSTLLTCNCMFRQPNLFYRSCQYLISDIVAVTRAELQKRGIEIPAESIFRKLIRDALKNVRRYRTPWTLPLLRRNPQIADWWLGEYVEKRMAGIRS
jgi:hypothetical protein